VSISHAMRKFYENDTILQKFNNKEISPEEFDLYMTMATIQTKLLTVEIAAQKVATNDNSTLKRLKNSGFISTTSIPVKDNIEEVFPCPQHGGCNINRHTCLDYSGTDRNINECQKCDNFGITRRQIAP
jgi:hypothetical protein